MIAVNYNAFRQNAFAMIENCLETGTVLSVLDASGKNFIIMSAEDYLGVEDTDHLENMGMVDTILEASKEKGKVINWRDIK